MKPLVLLSVLDPFDATFGDAHVIAGESEFEHVDSPHGEIRMHYRGRLNDIIAGAKGPCSPHCASRLLILPGAIS